ncbi:hypothetical protein [Nostoc sp. LPT]|nr:hypothetical protein [Nostoc sp. LPT]
MGKTSLRALYDEDFYTHESTTHGIEIKWLLTELLQGLSRYI